MADQADAETTAAAGRSTSRWRRPVQVCGSLLALVAGVWVVAQLRRQAGLLSLEPEAWIRVAAFGLAYAAVLLLPAASWWWLLSPRRSAGFAAPTPLLPTLSVWARANLSKYLPGNVFHLASRQLLGSGLGVGQGSLALASLMETLCLLAAATLVAFASLLASRPDWLRSLPILVLLFAVVVASLVALRRRAVPALEAGALRRMLSGSSLGVALALDAVFFLAGAGVLLGLVRLTAPEPAVPYAHALWTFTVSWLLGTVVPGAPAGLGVREAVLVTQLEASLTGPEASAVAVLLRLATLGGDLWLGLASWILRPPTDPKP